MIYSIVQNNKTKLYPVLLDISSLTFLLPFQFMSCMTDLFSAAHGQSLESSGQHKLSDDL